MAKKKTPTPEDGMMTLPGFEPPPRDPKEVEQEEAGKIAHGIFQQWYDEFYEGRYTQRPAHIMRDLKKFVLDVVVRGDTTPEQVAEAMARLGRNISPVTSPALQYSLGRVQRLEQMKQDAGANANMAEEDVFADAVMRTRQMEDRYGGEL